MVDFVGLDSGCVAAGQPQDVFVDQRVNENNEYLGSNRGYVSCTFVGGASAPSDGAPYYNCRPWASIDWTAPICVPLWLDSGSAGLAMTLWAYSATSVKASLRVTSGNLVSVLAQKDATIGTDFEDGGNQVVTAGFPSATNRAEWGAGQLWIQSRETAASVQTITCTSSGLAGRTAPITSALPTYPTSMPQSTTPDVCMLEDNVGTTADFLGSGGPGSSLILAKNKIKLASVLRIPISFVQCRSAGIRHLFTGQTLEVSVGSIAARQAVKGETHTKLAAKVQNNYDRKTLLAWGPPGYLPTERTEQWPGLMPVRFRGVQANASTGIASCLLQAGIEWRRNGGKMYIAMHLSSMYHGNSAGLPPGTANWSLAASYERPNGTDTDYSTPEVLASKTRVLKLVTRTSSVVFDEVAPPLLMTRRYMYGGTVRGTGQWGYAHREGQLFAEDMQILTTVIIEVDMSDVTPGTLATLRVDADYVTGTLVGFPPATTTPAALGRDLEVVCTGWSVYMGAA